MTASSLCGACGRCAQCIPIPTCCSAAPGGQAQRTGRSRTAGGAGAAKSRLRTLAMQGFAFAATHPRASPRRNRGGRSPAGLDAQTPGPLDPVPRAPPPPEPARPAAPEGVLTDVDRGYLEPPARRRHLCPHRTPWQPWRRVDDNARRERFVAGICASHAGILTVKEASLAGLTAWLDEEA